jgi:hypothetical protein
MEKRTVKVNGKNKQISVPEVTEKATELLNKRMEANGGSLVGSFDGKALGTKYTVIEDLDEHPFEGGNPYLGFGCEGVNSRGTQNILSFGQLLHYTSTPDGDWKWLEGYSKDDAFKVSDPKDSDASVAEVCEFVSQPVIIIGKKKATRFDGYFYAFAQE